MGEWWKSRLYQVAWGVLEDKSENKMEYIANTRGMVSGLVLGVRQVLSLPRILGLNGIIEQGGKCR